MKSGIYMIKNLETGKVYIGSTSNFRSRFYEHRRQLINNKHHSCYLQNSWNKRGKDAFVFQKLEYIEDQKERYIREQWWMDLFESYNSDYGYNIIKVSELGGAVHQELTKKKISISRKRWHKNNPDKSNSNPTKVVDFNSSPFKWKDFPTTKEACKYYNLSEQVTNNTIYQHLDKKTYKNMAFVTIDRQGYSRLKKIYLNWLKNKHNGYTQAIPIYALNLDTQQIEKFPSQSAFYKQTGRKLNRTILSKGHKVANYRPAYNKQTLDRWRVR